MQRSRSILGLGWLALDDTATGDVPSGVAALAALAATRAGHEVRIVGRVGQDRTGDELVRTLRDAGVDVSALQHDPDLPTPERRIRADGTCGERVDELPAAPDNLQWDHDLEDAARWADVVVFGLESWRSGQSRAEELRLLDEAGAAVRAADLTARTPSRRPDTPANRTQLETALEHASIALVDAPALGVLRGTRFAAGDTDAVLAAAADVAGAFRTVLLVATAPDDARPRFVVDGRDRARSSGPHPIADGPDTAEEPRPELGALLHAAIAAIHDPSGATIAAAVEATRAISRDDRAPDSEPPAPRTTTNDDPGTNDDDVVVDADANVDTSAAVNDTDEMNRAR